MSIIFAPVARALKVLIDNPDTDRDERAVYYECFGALAVGMTIADLEKYVKTRYIFSQPDSRRSIGFHTVYRIIVNNRTT